MSYLHFFRELTGFRKNNSATATNALK